MYGEETVGDLDGYEIVNNQLWYKVHLDLLAKWDFRDLRIALQVARVSIRVYFKG